MMFAPFLAGVIRVIVGWIVFALFEMAIGRLYRALTEPVRRRRVIRASARILVEDQKGWGESKVHDIVRYKFDDA